MEIVEMLKESGLTGNESKVYLELLKKGELSANGIAKNLSMDRTLAYTILNHLMDKGVVNYKIKEKKKFFQAENPESLLNATRKKEYLIKNLIKELNKIKVSLQKDYEIKAYEGVEGLRNLFNLMIKHKELLAFGATGRAYDMLYESHFLMKETAKKKARARVLMNQKYKGHAFTKYKNISIKYIDIKSEATTSIFGEYIVIHLIKEKPIMVVIRNKDIAETYRNHFNYLWKNAKK